MQSWRAAQPEDESFLFTLFAETKASEFAALSLAGAQLDPLLDMQYRGRKMTYTAQYPNADDSILLGSDGMRAGRLLVHRTQDCWRIVDIGVLAAERRKGLATGALIACQAQCRTAGAMLELQVAPMNPGRRLYERLGFRATSESAVAVQMVWDSRARHSSGG